MITNYYTLQALVREWAPDLVGCALEDAFSQVRDELTLAFADEAHAWMLRVSVQAPFYFLFRSEGYNRARRNVTTLFEGAQGRRVTAVRLAERDRMLYLDLEGGGAFQVMLFGPNANVFLLDAGGQVAEAFQADAELAGRPAPQPRPAPVVETFEAFDARWGAGRRTVEQALAAALPLFDRTLAAEAVHRAGIAVKPPADYTEPERRALFEAALGLRAELEHPMPRLYWEGRFVDVFSLVPLRHRSGQPEERFETADAAVHVFVRKALAQRRFRQVYEPLERALRAAHDHYRTGAERMLDELSRESRADRYEHWAHLLMASAAGQGAGREEVTLPDLFGGDAPVTVPLDPALSAVENAQRYYEKARRTRQARAHAEERMLEMERAAGRTAELLARLPGLEAAAEVERFRKELAGLPEVARFLGAEGEEDRFPFRRYRLPEDFEVWVGRNARQNDLLTFRYAQKYDLWMHARGVAGSHAVLRLPHRHARPGRHILERAAAIAAYHSKAQGSSLVPVMVTERKYVRKPKGAPPGAVVVEREDVLLVEPRLP